MSLRVYARKTGIVVKKNLIQRRRDVKGTLSQVLLPLLMFALLAVISQVGTSEPFPAVPFFQVRSVSVSVSVHVSRYEFIPLSSPFSPRISPLAGGNIP
jgi:hypothetical protein